LLAGLVRKEVLGVQADPRSPEHGQYGFLQDLVRHVTYETISKRERRTKHLAAAAFLSDSFRDDDREVVEVIASHYLEAHQAAPDADDAPEIKRRAYETFVRAAGRAASLAAAAEARRYYEDGAGLTDTPLEQAELLGRAGDMAGYAADTEGARLLYDRSIAIYEAEGDTHAAARISGRYGHMLGFTGRREEALERMERAFEVIRDDEPDEVIAVLAEIWNGPTSGPSSRSRSRSRRGFPRRWRWACERRAPCSSAADIASSRSPWSSRRSRSPSSTTCSSIRRPAISCSPTRVSVPTGTRRPFATSTSRSHRLDARGTVPKNGAGSPSAPTRS
jgi:tetratricopeptide (TPR) repeat protein